MHEWLAQVGREVGGVVLREAMQALGEGVVAASWGVRASAYRRRASTRVRKRGVERGRRRTSDDKAQDDALLPRDDEDVDCDDDEDGEGRHVDRLRARWVEVSGEERGGREGGGEEEGRRTLLRTSRA